MCETRTLPAEVEARARAVAEVLTARREHTDALQAGLRELPQNLRYATARTLTVENGRNEGIIIALAVMLGRPGDWQLVEEFIDNTPTWRNLL